ncbi:MAG: hypothetical protein IJ262_00395 [Clostridia bacterium]|nr:hypothetical protein [Clostridia bacterium]
MFFTLNISERKKSFSACLGDCFRRPEVYAEKISIEGCLPFYQINAQTHKGKVPWREIAFVADKLCRRGIFSETLRIDETSGIKRYESKALPLRTLFLSAKDIIKKLRTDCVKSCIAIFDENAYLTDLVEEIVFLCANIQIITSCMDVYEKLGKQLFEKYGVSPVIMCEPTSEVLKSTYIVSVDCSGVPALFKGIVFTCEKKRLLNATVLFSREITLPEKFEKYLPNGADKLNFAGALYELCGAKEFSQLRFNDMSVSED